ncbi:MAG: hypothetical protein ACFFG0_02725 [Candidatus Thorarchaeota archaeon]
MEQKYFSKKDAKGRLSFYIGFTKNDINVDLLTDALINRVISNVDIRLTENLIIFEMRATCAVSITNAQRVRLFNKCINLQGIIFRQASYERYKTTATAQEVINSYNINEKTFDYDDFFCIHEEKLTNEHVIEKHTINTQIDDYNVSINKLVGQREKEIKERILSLLK